MVVLVFFAPFIFNDYGWEWGLLYLVVALLPPVVQYMGFYGRMIHQMVRELSPTRMSFDVHAYG